MRVRGGLKGREAEEGLGDTKVKDCCHRRTVQPEVSDKRPAAGNKICANFRYSERSFG